MKQRRWLWQPCLLFIIIISDGQATEHCAELDEESILQKGHEYLYSLEAQAISEMSGTEDRSEISVVCNVLITHSHSCFYRLQMLNCSFASRYPSEEFDAVHEHMASLSRYPVMFFMSNGVISDVYSHPSDQMFSVNIKRGVLSVFVFKLSMTVKKMEEVQVDIHGSCPLISVPGKEGTGRVKTYRDLSHCIAKECTDPLLHGWSIISSKNFIKNFISSSTECQYEVNLFQKTMEEVLCKENHSVKVNFFQETSESTKTSIYYKMGLLQTTKLAADVRHKLPMRKTDISFECPGFQHPNSNFSSFQATAEKMLIDLIEISQNEIKLSSIRLFKTFTEWLRTSNNVMPFVESVLKCPYSSSFYEICSSALKKDLAVFYLTDGLFECSTISCIGAISYLSIHNFLPDVYLHYVLYSWSNMDHYNKSEIADHVMNICLQKNSKFCWLILGTLVKKCMMDPSVFVIPNSPKKIASYYDGQVSSLCRKCSSSSAYFSSVKEHNHLYTFIKAIGNIGEFYSVLVPNGVISLLTCFNSKSLPVYQKAAVLETLKKVCNNSEVCKVIHSKLLPVLVQQNEEVELQMHIFELFMLHPKNFNLLPIIVKILKENENSQMKSFIASYLETKMQDHSFAEENSQFIQDLLYELQKHKIQLTNFHQGKEKKSSISSHEGIFGLPFLPEEINKFGMKLDTLTIYRFFSLIPNFLRSNVVMHFFSKVAHIAQFGVHFEGLSNIGRIFMETFDGISEMKMPDFRKLISAFFEMLSSLNSKKPSYEPNYHLEEVIISNIKKIHNIYKTYNSEASPLFHAYFDLFGNTLNFLSLGDIVNFISGIKGNLFHEAFDHLHKGLVFNTSRIIRLVSAQYQVPTIIGHPLTWSSDLALAFSLHSKVKMGFNEESKPLWSTGVRFQPSAALTFLNKAVLGSPKVILTGILSNSSFYTSTHWKVEHTSTGSGNTWRLDIEKPEVSQTLLQYSHQNEVVKHSSPEDTASCDYRSSQWCFSDGISSVLGLKVCQELFDPSEAGERNPIKYIFGCYKRGIYVHPYDSELKAYSFEKISKKNEFGRDETELRFHTPDSAYKREVTLSLSKGKNMESSLNLRVPALPDFSASVFSKNFLEEDGKFGCKMQTVLQLSKDFKYQLIYTNSVSNGNITKSPSYTEFGDEIAGQLHKSVLQLETPFSTYKLIKKTNVKSRSSQQNIMASYSNLVSEWNWLSRILPLEFWETQSKAWIQVDFDSTETKLEKNEVRSQTSLGNIKSPHMFIQFILTSLTGPEREKMHFSLRRIKSESLELTAFLNATYNFWSSGDLSPGKEIRILNLTIPLRSWSAEIEKNVIINEGKALYGITFAQSAIISMDNGGHTNNVEWWHYEASDNFELEQQKYRFKVNLTDTFLHDVNPVKDGFGPDNKNEFLLMNKLTNFDVSLVKLLHPHGEIQEQVICNGKYLASTDLDLSKFQLDFALHLSRLNLKLVSSSLYQISKGLSEIFHKDTFTYLETGRKTVYNLFAQYSKTGDCNHVNFSHNISSYLVDFKSNVSYHCKPDDPKLHVLLLNIDSSSAVWNTLNSELRQIIEDVNHEFSEESMNHSSPLMVINVTADWRGAHDRYDHTKKAIFTSLWDKVPSFEINFKSMMDGHRFFQINFHDEKEVRMLSKIQLLKRGNFQVEINYSDISNQELVSFISMESILQNTGERVWAGEINRASLENVILLCKNLYLGAGEIMSSISSESSHPLNQVLKPMLNATLLEYWTSVKCQGEAAFNLMLLEMENVAKSLEPLYFPVISVICNSLQEVKTIASYLSHVRKDPSEIQSNYPSLLNYAVSRIHHISKELFYVDYENQHKITFKFKSIPVFEMLKFNKAFSPMFPSANNLVTMPKKELQQFYQKASGSKLALIYQRTQIYSFDGHFYEFPNYKSECIFLLSHDVHKTAFSIAASVDSLHFLFPTVTISINWKNEVYVNGSKHQNSLPMEAENGNVTIRREGEIIFVQSPFLSVLCDGRNLICALESSGWNSNNILGILGNADGEVHNEYMLPDGKIASNISVFAAAYELTGHKECKATDILVKLREVDDVKEICRRGSKRKGRQGEKEEPNNYCYIAKGFQTTSQDTCEGNFNEDIDVPFSSKAVSAVCYLEGFGTKLSSNFEGGKQEITHVRPMLEIVLLVNEHSLMCDGSNSYINIENVLEALEKKFHSENYLDVKYSLVGFGGKGVHFKPSIHTVDSNIWVPYKVLLDRLLKTLEFQGTSTLNDVIPIKYAAESLGYDTFGSKIFMLFTYEDEQKTDQEILETSIKHLLKNGISLYVFVAHPGIEKGSVFGIRSDGSLLCSSKTVNVQQLIMHNGDLAKIAFATGGIVFAKGSQSSNSFSECYLEFVQEVWNKVKKEETFCRNCQKVQGLWWNSYQECTVQNC